jgi:hypothetical protein
MIQVSHPIRPPAIRAAPIPATTDHELVHLSWLAVAHSEDEFRDPPSAAHAQLIDIVWRLAGEPQVRR